MQLKKIITMVLYNRPHYTARTLRALQGCEGIHEYKVFAHIEPGCDEVLESVRGIDFAEVEVVMNPSVYGIGLNTFRAWENGFNHADFIIHLEDDTVPAPDCLKLIEAMAAAGRDDSRLLSVCAYNRHPCPRHLQHAFAERPAYNCWLVGVWKSRWNWISSDWNPDPRMYAHYLSVRARCAGLMELFPLLSRCQNIGAVGGVHVPSVQWHRKHQHTEHWAGDVAVPSGSYVLRIEAPKAE